MMVGRGEVVLPGPQEPERRPRGVLARLTGEGLPARGHLPLAPDLLRGPSWDLLPARVTDRLEELAGERIEWWARAVPGFEPGGPRRGQAVLVGTSGVAFADPQLNADRRPVYAISCFVLDPASARRSQVVARPARPAGGAASRTPQAGRAVAGTGHDGDLGVAWQPPTGLSPRDVEVLDNLPVRARDLLLAPFQGGALVLRCEVHYEGTPERFSMFGMVLAGSSRITVAAGTRFVPAGHTERTAHWSLVCVRADVVRRIGTGT